MTDHGSRSTDDADPPSHDGPAPGSTDDQVLGSTDDAHGQTDDAHGSTDTAPGSTDDGGSRSDVVRTGRPLDADGDPLDGPALELDPGGPAGALLREAPRPLASNPGAGTWGTLLERPGEGEADDPVLLQFLAPDAAAPPAHVHPTTEIFAVLEGTLTVVLDGRPRRLDAGESVTVDPGVEHAFRNDTDGFVAFRARMPSMRTVRGLYTVWGRDHEGAFGPGGEFGRPGPLQALVIGEDLADGTVTTALPRPVQRVLWATVGRVARLAGYRGVDPSYLADDFWERHVEQPDLDG